MGGITNFWENVPECVAKMVIFNGSLKNYRNENENRSLRFLGSTSYLNWMGWVLSKSTESGSHGWEWIACSVGGFLREKASSRRKSTRCSLSPLTLFQSPLFKTGRLYREDEREGHISPHFHIWGQNVPAQNILKIWFKELTLRTIIF